MFAKSRISLVISGIIASQIAYGESAPHTEDKLVITGAKDNYHIDVNTSAMRMEISQLETPGQVNVIGEQLIEEQGATQLGQVLANDSSISAGGTSRNRERFYLRGFSLSSSTGFLRDGKQHWSHYRQPIELLEQVEVLKGPAGLLYGKSAPGGLVNMVAKKPTRETNTQLRLDYGSDQDIRGVLDVSGALTEDERLRARVVLSSQNYDGWRDYNDGSTPDTERFVGGLFVEYDLTDNATLSVHYDKTRDHGSVDSGAYFVDGKAVLGDKHIWDAQWSKIKNDVENIGADLSWDLNSEWNLKLGYNHQGFIRRDIESFSRPSSYDSETGTFTYNGYDRYDDWQFDTAYIDLTGEFSTGDIKHQMLMGGNWLGYYYKRQAQYLRGYTATVGEPMAKPEELDYRNVDARAPSITDSMGIYLQDMVTLNDQWQVLLGGRFDREDSKGQKAQSHFLPKAAVIFHPEQNASVYFTYSESFEPKNPVSNERDLNDGMKLDPVKGEMLELGTKWELFDRRLLLSAALFDITQKNIVLSRDISETGSGQDQETVQAGEQVHRGLELSAAGSVNNKLSLQASVTFLDAEIKDPFNADLDGTRPADVAEFSASVWSRYAVTDRTSVNLGAVHEGERYGTSGNTYLKDGYTRFDAAVSHEMKLGGDTDVTLSLKVENLFDKDYVMGGDQDNTVVGEGRNFLASVQFSF